MGEQSLDPRRLREALDLAGYTGAKLAKELGISRGLISHWLTGHKECPPKYVQQIANRLKIDRGWLMGAAGQLRPGLESTSEKQVDADRLGSAGWAFRGAPSDGGKDFGSANIWTIPADIATLVREVGQNSLDNTSPPGTMVQMRYRIIELSKSSPERSAFLEGLKFSGLRTHIEKASLTKSRLATRLKSGLKRLDAGDRLVLLRIDDYGTTGLYGSEVTQNEHEPNPFAALLRNNLDSSKQSTTAGGSYGLGKAVLWRCSDLSTVLFASRIMPRHASGHGRFCRFMGKAELTWHEDEAGEFAGPGWLGKGERPDSLRLSGEELSALQLSRDDIPHTLDQARIWGTSILIVGFRDPASEEVLEGGRILQAIAAAVADNFWPCIMRERLRVGLERFIDGELREEIRELDPIDYVPELCEALVKSDAGELAEQLREESDVVRVAVKHRVPRTKDEATDLLQFPDDVDAQAQLVVRLAGNNMRDKEHLNTVALVRGREMVVRYWSRANIVVGGLPFHAVLLAGTSAGGEQPQVAAEQFLRLAEPPAHDRWEPNEEIREKYAWGAGTRLRELFEAVTDLLRNAIRPTDAPKDEGPQELKRLLQLNFNAPPAPKPATLRNIRWKLVDACWEVEAEIHINDRSRAWMLTPRLTIDVESGTRPRLPWRDLQVLETPRGAARPESASIVVEPKTRRVKFRAVSEPEVEGIVAAKCRARLDIQAQELSS